jgi:membrane protein implicated in regulation of membrane protease activity
LVIGIILVISEMLTGGIFLIFIALGAFSSALVSSLGQGYTAQGIVCAIVSVLGVILLRKPIQRKFLKGINIKADLGTEILVDNSLQPNTKSRISYQGTTWDALNIDSVEINKNDKVRIIGIDGNVLLLKKSN